MDGSFELSEQYRHATPKCKGKWELIGDGFILLKCAELDEFGSPLSSGYMVKREHRLTIINGNKVKYKDYILRRQK